MHENDINSGNDDPEAFLAEQYCWQLVNIVEGGTIMFSVHHMTEQQIKESIIDDALAITMWEKAWNKTIDVDIDKFLRFCPEVFKDKIKDMIANDPEVSPLLVITNGQIRVRSEEAILQAAMDFCGVYYDGFMPTDTGEPVFSFNRERMDDLIKQYGSIDNVAKVLAMDLEAGDKDISKALN